MKPEIKKIVLKSALLFGLLVLCGAGFQAALLLLS